MNDNMQTIVYASAIEDISSVNTSFDKGILRVAYWGRNRNNTFISKEAFVRAIPTIYNCPVVCNYIRETDSIGSHDVEVVHTDRGLRMVNITTPVGVVPESAEVFWENVAEDDGTIHEYMCVPIYLWKRQEAYAHIKENGITDESMEIRIIHGTKRDDGCYEIEDFEFTAFCLLESANPCFESAQIELFSLNKFREQYAVMMEDFKREFSLVMTDKSDGICTENGAEDFTEKGDDRLDVNELMAKYGIAEEDIDFDIASMAAEDIEQRFAEIASAKSAGDNSNFEEDAGAEGSDQEPEQEPEDGEGEGDAAPENDPDPDDDEPLRRAFSLTGEQFNAELQEALWAVTYNDPTWGECIRYGYVDYDMAVNEVYAYDFLDWKLYGFAYSMNGDLVVIDFDSKKRKRFAFVDFDMGEEVQFSYKGMFATYETRLTNATRELDELKEFKCSIENAEREAQVKAVFEKFSALAGNERFAELMENYGDMTIDEIEDKCYSIKGRMDEAKFSLNQETGSTRMPAGENNTDDDEPYGGIFRRFGIGN